jgi:hypothetical protein
MVLRPLEELNSLLVLGSGRARFERTEIPTLPGLRILFA